MEPIRVGAGGVWAVIAAAAAVAITAAAAEAAAAAAVTSGSKQLRRRYVLCVVFFFWSSFLGFSHHVLSTLSLLRYINNTLLLGARQPKKNIISRGEVEVIEKQSQLQEGWCLPFTSFNHSCDIVSATSRN